MKKTQKQKTVPWIQSFIHSLCFCVHSYPGLIIKSHLMPTMFTVSFHNINHTILLLVIIPYLHYVPLMGINAPYFGTEYIGTPPPDEYPPPQRRAGMPCQFCVISFKLSYQSCHITTNDIIGCIVDKRAFIYLRSDMTEVRLG